ncbi:hypothetical protein CRUP_029896 [Coryphaenoides rupestris]|nr:hypothetical protein CRUP_029896 [Coryphaenoides rupestris]
MSSSALLAALVALGVAPGVAPGSRVPGCDNGKSYPGVDTVYDPEPAKLVCMSQPINYPWTIPNRPVGAESGEYVYCPPERWLNNVHHGATVLLYHPCAPLSERVRLSVLARSCLSDYIITPHPQLERTHVALVSWGQTLELSTVLTSGVCDWLESVAAAAVTGTIPDDMIASRNYSLLLIRPAEQRNKRLAKQARTNTMQSVRRCCEQSLYTSLDQGEEARREGGGVERRGRRRREDIKKQEMTEAKSNHKSSPSTSSQTLQASRTSKSKPSPEPPAFGGHPDSTVLGSAHVKATVAVPRGSLDPVEALAGSAGEGKLTGAVKQTGQGSAGQNSAEQDTSSHPQDRRENNNDDGDQWVDVKQRQLEQKHTHAIGGDGGKIKTSAPPPHPNPHKPTPIPGSHGAEPVGQAPRVPGGKVRTPAHGRGDVIRRRLRIAERRHRRKSSQARRQESVLLPSSDEQGDEEEEDDDDVGGD